MDLLDRTARIEERGKSRDAWQEATTADIAKLRADIGKIGTDLGVLVAEINAAKTVARFGGNLISPLIKPLLLGAAGGTVGWLAALWAKH